MLSDTIASVAGTQTTQQTQQQPTNESINDVAREIKTETDVAIEFSRSIESASLNNNRLLFNVMDEGVEARILSDKGELIKTIPPKDLNEIMKQNFIPSLGNLLNVVS